MDRASKSSVSRKIRVEITQIFETYPARRTIYFLCVGDPFFKNPRLQAKVLEKEAKEKGVMPSSFLVRNDPLPRDLANNVRRLARTIRDEPAAVISVQAVDDDDDAVAANNEIGTFCKIDFCA